MRRRRRLARDPPESRGNDSRAESRDSRPVHLPGPRRHGAGRRAVRRGALPWRADAHSGLEGRAQVSLRRAQAGRVHRHPRKQCERLVFAAVPGDAPVAPAPGRVTAGSGRGRHRVVDRRGRQPVRREDREDRRIDRRAPRIRDRTVASVRDVPRRGRATPGRVAEGRCDPGERGGVSSAPSPGDLQGQRDRRSETPVMRRILIIAYHFPPDAAVGALRPLKFAKYLPQFGWEPWVLTVRPEYYESLDRSRLDEVRYPSKVFPTRMLPHPNALYKSVKASCYTVTGRRQEFSRKLIEADVHPDSHGWLGKIRKFLGMLLWIPPDEVLGWLPIAALKGVRLVKAHRITHIYTTNPTHTTHLVGLAIRSFCDVKWVADFRDRWLFDKPFQTRTADRIEHWMERKVVENADAVTLTTDRMADKFRAADPTVGPH